MMKQLCSSFPVFPENCPSKSMGGLWDWFALFPSIHPYRGCARHSACSIPSQSLCTRTLDISRWSVTLRGGGGWCGLTDWVCIFCCLYTQLQRTHTHYKIGGKMHRLWRKASGPNDIFWATPEFQDIVFPKPFLNLILLIANSKNITIQVQNLNI